eukprot:TRINITY_DN75212_c0_g1_i1.p1 TRINITY_DN75212_c0_g1~~TRINITY_DN75212_c0_g1_i1.p1  ORF type:complete len:533 (+),score=73.99 TRINITY_DN75212_c0_g1_i1:66-1601(+)
MGARQSSSPSDVDDGFGLPLVQGRVRSSTEVADEEVIEVCAVCLGEMSVALSYKLPGCGHEFHALCLASALQFQMLCPVCRVEVQRSVAVDLASALLNDPRAHGGSTLAAELLTGTSSGSRAATVDSEVPAEATIAALKRAANRGDATKIPSIAALLKQGDGAQMRSPQPVEVRVEAVRALHALVPGYPRTWVGTPAVLDVLRKVCVMDSDACVQAAAVRALKEVAERGESSTLAVLQSIFEGRAADSDFKLDTVNTLQALALRGDTVSMRACLAALQDNDFSVRATAQSTLRYICPRGECGELLPDISDVVRESTDPEVRKSAVELIGQIEVAGGTCGLNAAKAALSDSNEEVQSAALQALGQLWQRGDSEAVAFLSDLVLQPSRQLQHRQEAMLQLSRVAGRGEPTAIWAFMRLLDESDLSLRSDAMKYLKLVSAKDEALVVEGLLTYVGHSDKDVQRLAIEALGCLTTARGDTYGVVELLRRLQANDKDPDHQQLAEGALRQMGVRSL